MHSGSGMTHAPGGVASTGEPAATNRVQRLGDRVRRPVAFWSNAVHGLLAHLEAVDFPAPRLRAVTRDYEELTWIEGESGPDAWSKVVAEDGLGKWAAFLRRYHDAVADYRPPHDAVWSRVAGCGFVCHGDPGPWNTVWLRDEIVAFIDFDHAHPGSPLDDIVYSLEFGAPFRDDATCLADMRYPAPPDRRRRIESSAMRTACQYPPDSRPWSRIGSSETCGWSQTSPAGGLNRRPHGSGTATSTRSGSALPGPCPPESDPALKAGSLGRRSAAGPVRRSD